MKVVVNGKMIDVQMAIAVAIKSYSQMAKHVTWQPVYMAHPCFPLYGTTPMHATLWHDINAYHSMARYQCMPLVA